MSNDEGKVVPTEEEVAAQEAAAEIEKEARIQGWVPKEEFRGPEADWADAETFVRRGKEINPILKKNNERLLREIEKQRGEIEEIRAAAAEFREFQRESFEKKKNALEQELRDLREEKKAAAANHELEKVIEIDEKMESVREEQSSLREERKEAEKQKEEKPATKELHPAFKEWMDRNPWYSSNMGMANFTNYAAENLAKQNPGLADDTEAFLKELDKELDKSFTEEQLGRTKKKLPRTPVEPASGSKPSSPKGKKTYDDLPADAKAACDRFTSQKLMTKEEYIAEYFATDN